MSRMARVVVLVAALGGMAGTAWAQYPQRRDGFWIGFGLGYGWARVQCDNCIDSSSVGGVTGFLKLGGAPSRHLLIGASVNGWSHPNAGLTETMANVTASLYLYPRVKSGFFLTGGLGISKYHVNSVPSTDGTGWGLTAGAGYDIRFGRDVSLTPVANFQYGALADFDAVAGGGTIITARGWKQTVLDVGLGVTFH